MQVSIEENSGISFSGKVLINHMSFDVIQCFCNNSAWYQIHLYEPGKKLSQQKLFSSVQIGWGEKKKIYQSLAVSPSQLSTEML